MPGPQASAPVLFSKGLPIVLLFVVFRVATTYVAIQQHRIDDHHDQMMITIMVRYRFINIMAIISHNFTGISSGTAIIDILSAFSIRHARAPSHVASASNFISRRAAMVQFQQGAIACHDNIGAQHRAAEQCSANITVVMT